MGAQYVAIMCGTRGGSRHPRSVRAEENPGGKPGGGFVAEGRRACCSWLLLLGLRCAGNYADNMHDRDWTGTNTLSEQKAEAPYSRPWQANTGAMPS